MDFKKTQETVSPKGEGSSRKCPACGASAREQARFCSTCGRALEGSYFPTDALRSSYHQQETYEKDLRKTVHKKHDENEARASEGTKVVGKMFEAEKNTFAKMALAFATYALIPYLGILFCPCAVLLGGFGLARSYHFPKYDGRRAAFVSIVLGILILLVQLVLWWLLYKVPE